MSTTSIIAVIVLMLLLFYIASVFNMLLSLKNRFQNAFSQVEVQLKQRYDLISNLVETCRADLSNERETLETLIKYRHTALADLKAVTLEPANRQAIRKLSIAETQLHRALEKLTIAIEAHYTLQASETILQLKQGLSNAEQRVIFARQAFNDAITEYNSYQRRFPANVLSAVFGHCIRADLLEFENSADIQEAAKVSP